MARPMPHSLEALRVFCTAAESENFRAAAHRLAVSPQVVTRVVRELEQQLGEPLFHRSTRGVQLTRFGEQLAQRARVAVQGVDALFSDHQPKAAAQAVEGVVRITAPGVLGRRFLLDALAPLSLAHPGLVLDLRLSEVRADVVDQQIDVGVRIGQLRDARFVAREANRMGFHVVGTPELLARVGRPRNLAALAGKPVTALVDLNSGRLWPWYFRGAQQWQPPPPAFITDDPVAEGRAVMAGLALGQLPDFMVREALRDGRLVAVLASQAPEPWPLCVYRPQRGPVPARVRLVFDALVQALQDLDGAALAP